MEPTEWEITQAADKPGRSVTEKFTGSYAAAKERARALFQETGRFTSIWTGLTWHFRISPFGERDWSKNAFTAAATAPIKKDDENE